MAVLRLSAQHGRRWIICFGDSRTAVNGTRGSYVTDLETMTPTTFLPAWRTYNGGSGGEKVSTALAAIATKLEAAPTLAQTGSDVWVLLNWGVNDISAGENVEATWKANYLAIIDAVQLRWPTAKVYLMRPWKRGATTACNNLATWITAIVGARSNVFVGPDERTWLENGDDGTTYTYDGVHYTGTGDAANGTLLCAQEWKAVIWP